MQLRDINRVVNGIKIYDPSVSEDDSSYNSKGLDNLYQFEKRHFWFRERKEFIYSYINTYIPITSAILELGAGTGNIARYLQIKGYKNLSVGEMHLKGLEYAKSYGIKQLLQFDLMKATFESEYDAVFLFDVLEHIEQDNFALENIHLMLRDRGYIILTVPAHMWLWSRRDSIAGHKRRYNKRRLKEALCNAGFELIDIKYFFLFLVPFLYFRRLTCKDDKSPVRLDERGSEHLNINQFTNSCFLATCRLNKILNNVLPNVAGGSLIAVARKQQYSKLNKGLG